MYEATARALIMSQTRVHQCPAAPSAQHYRLYAKTCDNYLGFRHFVLNHHLSPFNLSILAAYEDEEDPQIATDAKNYWLSSLHSFPMQGKTDLLRRAKEACDMPKKLLRRTRKTAREEFHRMITESLEQGGDSFLHKFTRNETQPIQYTRDDDGFINYLPNSVLKAATSKWSKQWLVSDVGKVEDGIGAMSFLRQLLLEGETDESRRSCLSSNLDVALDATSWAATLRLHTWAFDHDGNATVDGVPVPTDLCPERLRRTMRSFKKNTSIGAEHWKFRMLALLLTLLFSRLGR